MVQILGQLVDDLRPPTVTRKYLLGTEIGQKIATKLLDTDYVRNSG